MLFSLLINRETQIVHSSDLDEASFCCSWSKAVNASLVSINSLLSGLWTHLGNLIISFLRFIQCDSFKDRRWSELSA